jgi:hypothetical protein
MRVPSRHVLPRLRLRPLRELRSVVGPIALAWLCGCSGAIGDAPDQKGTGTGTGAGGSGISVNPEEIPAMCKDGALHTGRAPLRRITRFEYTNTVRDLLGDATSPGNGLPPEDIGTGFGNSADAQSVSSLLAKSYRDVGEAVAIRATDPAAIGKLLPCATGVTAATQDACARTFIDGFAPKAYRRPLAAGESDELLTLEKAVAAKTDFATGIASVIATVLQSSDFLYRLEFGANAVSGNIKQLTGDEMATRLSYFLWGTLPDDTLRNAAKGGELGTAPGVLTHATRMLDDQRSRPVVRFFFDNLFPLSILTGLDRDHTLFPAFSPTIAGYMRDETQTFLEYQIFQAPGSSWKQAFIADYTFVNGPLATFYGITGVQNNNAITNVMGNGFVKVPVDTSKRLGFLLQAGMMTGTITTNKSNPVLRGSFIINKLLCRHISLPTDPAILAQVKVPEDTSGATARERFSKHSTQPICATCHKNMDPFGFALENFDPIGQWRDTEGTTPIDTTVTLPGSTTTVNGPVDLVKSLSEMDEAQTCFASHWLDFAYGRSVGDEGDACTIAIIDSAFKQANFNVKQLLLNLTQTDAFLYYPGSQ